MELIASILRKLIIQVLSLRMSLNVFKEVEKYEYLLEKAKGKNFDDYKEVREKVMKLENELEILGYRPKTMP